MLLNKLAKDFSNEKVMEPFITIHNKSPSKEMKYIKNFKKTKLPAKKIQEITVNSFKYLEKLLNVKTLELNKIYC